MMDLYSRDKVQTWQDALEVLKRGNESFSKGLMSAKSLMSTLMLKELAENGQHPFATVLTCSDSRVPAELVFDQGLGALFVIRVAGNVVQPSQIASIEYAAQVLKTPLCVVMGHSRCGAIKAAVDMETAGTDPGSENIRTLLGLIRPAVRTALEKTGPKSDQLIAASTLENVRRTARHIMDESDLLRGLKADGKFGIVNAVFQLETATVQFDSHT